MNECTCLWIRISTLVSSLASLLDSLRWRLCRGLSFNRSWNTHRFSLLYSTYTVEFSIWNYDALKWTSLHLIALFWADCISHSISFSTCFLSLECTGSAFFHSNCQPDMKHTHLSTQLDGYDDTGDKIRLYYPCNINIIVMKYLFCQRDMTSIHVWLFNPLIIPLFILSKYVARLWYLLMYTEDFFHIIHL